MKRITVPIEAYRLNAMFKYDTSLHFQSGDVDDWLKRQKNSVKMLENCWV